MIVFNVPQLSLGSSAPKSNVTVAVNCLNLKCFRKQLFDCKKKKQEHLPTEEPLFKRYTWDPLNSGWAGIC